MPDEPRVSYRMVNGKVTERPLLAPAPTPDTDEPEVTRPQT